VCGVSETLQLNAAGACLFSYLLKGPNQTATATGFVALVLPMLPPIAHSSGPPSSASSPFQSLYMDMGMVMIALVGVVTFDKPGKGATSIHQAVIFSKPEAPVEERHTGSLLLLLRFLRSCAWCGCRCTRFSDCGDDLQDPPAHRLPSP
jgi:hypothetical protein